MRLFGLKVYLQRRMPDSFCSTVNIWFTVNFKQFVSYVQIIIGNGFHSVIVTDGAQVVWKMEL